MSRHRKIDQAPVLSTCPIIDNAQDRIEKGIEFIESLEWDDDEYGRGMAKEALIAIKHLRAASDDLLEQIRDANDLLRRWGNEQYYEAEEKQERIDELEKKLEDARD